MTKEELKSCMPSEDEMQFGVEQIMNLGEQLGHHPIKWGVICAAVTNLIEDKTGLAIMPDIPEAELH